MPVQKEVILVLPQQTTMKIITPDDAMGDANAAAKVVAAEDTVPPSIGMRMSVDTGGGAPKRKETMEREFAQP